MRYRCTICGETFELPEGAELACPICFAPGELLEPLGEFSLPTGDTSALYNIGYGLYVITSRGGERDNAMICNTVVQLTSDPTRVAVAINKSNYSHGLISESGILNVCPISESAPFALFQAFGFRSGRDTDKLEGVSVARSGNGLCVPLEHINSYMSLAVESSVDVGTHTLFICTMTDSGVIEKAPTMSYAYYHAKVKPKKTAKKSGYVCKICGYVYEGDELPADFVCPICKHGAQDFEKI